MRSEVNLTLHTVCIAEGVQRVLTGGRVGRDIGNHDSACLLSREGVPQDL